MQKKWLPSKIPAHFPIVPATAILVQTPGARGRTRVGSKSVIHKVLDLFVYLKKTEVVIVSGLHKRKS